MRDVRDTLDFIVIGAQKAGTTSLFRHLRQHPEIAIPADKELPYFSHDRAYARGWSAYMQLVSRQVEVAEQARKWGTVTPHYMVGGVYQRAEDIGANDYDEHTVPSRIHERLPDARLVAILRDPVERAVSHHRMQVAAGAERRSFDDAVEELLRAPALEHARRYPEETNGYVAWGEYGRILAGYLDVFPRERVLVVFTDELERAAASLLCRVHSFVGVSSDFEPRNLGQRYRVGATVRGFSWASPSSWMTPSSPLSPQGVQRALRRSSAVRAAFHAVGEERQRQLRRPYERLATRVAKRNRRAAANDVGANSGPSPATLARLREHYGEDAERLLSMLGATPSWHEKARGEEPAGAPPPRR